MRTVVAVLRGGPGSEYEHSLKSGAQVLQALDGEKYEPRDVFIDRQGQWHAHGVPVLPERALRGADVALNVVYGPWGEGGALASILEKLNVPYPGSSPALSLVSGDRQLLKKRARDIGITVAHSTVLRLSPQRAEEAALALFRSFPQPSVVHVGDERVLADTFHTLQWALGRAAAEAPTVTVEEHLAGRSAGAGVIENFRNEDLYALIPQGESLSPEEKQRLMDAAKKLHKGLGLSHYSHADFLVSKRGIYFTGLSLQPRLSPQSAFMRGLESVGAKLSHFLDHVISLARTR